MYRDVDEMGIDEMGVDEVGSRRSGTTPEQQCNHPKVQTRWESYVWENRKIVFKNNITSLQSLITSSEQTVTQLRGLSKKFVD